MVNRWTHLISSGLDYVLEAIRSYRESTFPKTYTPVVQCTMVLLMLTFGILIDLKSNKGEVTYTFIHTCIVEVENVYVDMTKGFEQHSKTGRKKCLKFKICSIVFVIFHVNIVST